MSAPGCGIIFAPSQRIDRRASLRKSFTLNKKAAVAGRPPVTSLQGPDMGFSQGHNLALSEKMRQLQARKRREQDILAGKSQPAAMHTPVTRRNPRHLDLMEAASLREKEARRVKPDEKARQYIGSGKENARLDCSKKLAEQSSARTPTAVDQSYRQIAYNQYLEEAFGLNADQRPQPSAIHRLRTQEAPLARPDSDMSARSEDSMEVNFHMASKDIPVPSIPSAKDRRPKIQVTIPGKQSAPSPRHLVHQLNRQKTTGKTRDRPTDVSPPSSVIQQKQNVETPARLSIVSPLSVVEMPKPRRPFSALSLEDMTNDVHESEASKHGTTPEKLPISDSDDTSHDEDRSSNYSPRSSMSSMSYTGAQAKGSVERRHSIAFSIINPATAGVFDNLPLVPKVPKHHLKVTKSCASLAPDTNKPLPPEPGMEDVAPLNLPGRSYSRNSMHGKRKAPTPLTISRSSTIDVPASRLPSRVSSLRSKYTPADLDALDAAFVQSSPQTSFNTQQPTLEQAELELEAHLGTIEEDDGAPSYPLMHEPLQISRGPNHMVPSRQAPPPPSSTNIKLSDGSTSYRRRLGHKKASVHVAMQMKIDHGKDAGDLRRRISAPLGGSLKAQKILGHLDSTEHHTPMQREASSESNWSSSESPETSYAASSSPELINHEGTATPETDVSSVPDPAFEEVRARLELLSPKNDSKPYLSLSTSEHNEIKTTPRPTATGSGDPAPNVQDFNDSQVEIPIQFDESITVSCEESQDRRGRTFQDDARSLASIAMSEIPDLYAELPPPLPSPIPMMREPYLLEETECIISADAAEKVLLRILQNLDNLQDLFATATVSRGFYRTFKRHELPLMKNALHGMSPAAWELREMSVPLSDFENDGSLSPRLGYNPTLYLQHYMRDMYTMIALKSMILIHCESFLRTDTITALAGGETERASQIDDAFWRVWTFCQIFGCGSNREDDIAGQMDWLRGGVQARQQARNASTSDSLLVTSPMSFGKGNAGGLSADELYDMTEIWTCLGVLVRGFQGKRQEAREFGVFDNADIPQGDIEAEDSVLEEWSYHLLTLAPPTVLDVTSPTSPTAATFAHARSRGYTSWTPPPISRATFLKEAISRIYQEKIAATHTASAPSSPHSKLTTPALEIARVPTNSDEGTVSESIAARWRCNRHAAEIRAKRNDPNFSTLPPSEDRPMSEYPNVVARLDSQSAPPVPTVPTHRATPSETDTAKHMVSALVVPAGPQVRDPVDVAVDKLVAMGFEASKAKKALADTDTGNNVDFEGALEHLVRERKRDVNGMMHAGYRGKVEERGLRSGPPLMSDDIVSPVHGDAAIGLGLSGLSKFG